MRDLTSEETTVINLLLQAWNIFATLPVVYLKDGEEFRHAIHAAQNIVLARPAIEDGGRRRMPKVKAAE